MCSFVIVVLVTTASASPGIQASLGDTVMISGYSYGSQTVYLFLTGPNLPANGVALNDITKHADQSGFTRVQVDGNDRWFYNWDTADIGGGLDEGTYTIWVVNGPNDRSRLNEADYRTISVTLGKPGISVDMPVKPGAMVLHSVPDAASVIVGEKYQGKTPLTVGDLAPGTYDVLFSKFGYQKFSLQVPVEPEKTSEVTATLIPSTGSLTITSVPAGARVMIDGEDAGVSPVIRENLTAGNHTLGLAADGYTTSEQIVTVIAGETIQISINLALASLSKEETVRGAGPAPTAMVAFVIGILLVIRRLHLH
jgi:hypothetical protein